MRISIYKIGFMSFIKSFSKLVIDSLLMLYNTIRLRPHKYEFIESNGDICIQYTNWRGKLHRTDGPAIQTKKTIEYWVKGKVHRIDGPAIETFGTDILSKRWYINGKLHRPDGPAVEYDNGQAEWYWENEYLHGGIKEWLQYAPVTDDRMGFLKLKYGGENA